MFVGRGRELAELLDALGDAVAGRGSLVLLAGEPGIGKSRLAGELATRAGGRGLRVVWGRCWEAGGAPAHWPWVQVLRSTIRGRDARTVREWLGPGAVDVAQMLPEVRDLVPDLGEPPTVDPDSARFQLFDSTAVFLRSAAAAEPLVIIIEDLHAADTASILLLRYLAGQLGDIHALVVGTYRDIELTPDHPLRAALPHLERESTTRRFELGGLSEPDVAAFLAAGTGLEDATGLVSSLHRETNGNPLFLQEAVRLLATEGRLRGGGPVHVEVPAGVRAVIGRRLDHLDDPCRDLLSAASVLGNEFTVEALRRLAGLGHEEVLDLLDQAVEAGLVAPVQGTLGRFRFAHDLVRVTLYEEHTPTNRMRLHRRAAEALEEVYANDPEPHLAELARHYYEAAPLGDAAVATDTARRAGESAALSLAYEDASRLYGMAVQAAELGGLTDREDLGELVLALGDAQARSGDQQTAKGTFLRVAESARRTRAGRLLARAALGYGGRLGWARAGSDQHLVPLLRDAIAELGGQDDRLRIRLLSRLACALRSSPDRGPSDDHSREAVELARSLGDPASLAVALSGRCWATFWPENTDERLELAVELVRVVAEVDDAELMFEAHQVMGMFLLERGAVAEGGAEIEAMVRAAEELRQPAQEWAGLPIQTAIALLQGDLRRAEDLTSREPTPGRPAVLEEGLSLASAHQIHRFLLYREQGRLAELEASTRAAAARFPWYPFHKAALACLLLELGHEAEARPVFAELAADEFRALYRDNEWLFAASLTAEACAGLGAAVAAGVLYEQLLPFEGRHAMAFPEGSVGAVDRYLGLLATTMGRRDDAERHLSRAIEVNERMGARAWQAHAEHDLAVVLVDRDRPGDRERAAELLSTSLRTARELGMSALEARLTSAGGEEAPEPAGHADLTRPVFRREGEYWSVVFEGDAFRLRDSKGLRYLATLLAAPGREVHALDLIGAEAGAEPERAAIGDAGEVLDPQAKAAYRRRLEELREDVEEAESWNDPERAARAREELDFLARELAVATGLGGRDRRSASASERARVNVTRAIKAALGRIAEHSPALGRHLETTVRTGAFCSYSPDSRLPVRWQLSSVRPD
jgi:tetratricopeptide (TPR) repeat protein